LEPSFSSSLSLNLQRPLRLTFDFAPLRLSSPSLYLHLPPPPALLLPRLFDSDTRTLHRPMKSPVLLSLPFAPLLAVQALPNPFASQKADRGMVIPISKSAEYLAKRSSEEVDLDLLLGSRDAVKL